MNSNGKGITRVESRLGVRTQHAKNTFKKLMGNSHRKKENSPWADEAQRTESYYQAEGSHWLGLSSCTRPMKPNQNEVPCANCHIINLKL
jgi:hypothetical protein